ncbi:MAG TPA: hypothetical protein VEF71_07350 [Streptosporangiaceae bacterium]|nr:hypothetical protein [Streptosporangiaceae bacterium]
MVEWRTKPQLDSGSGAGFQLIVVGYGVILITVFPANLADLRSNGIQGLLHLLLAGTMIVISWMGYYSNRQRYPVWRGEFFDIPMLQYLLSFAILFLYWGLGITALPQNPQTSKGSAPVLPNPFDEAVIIFAVFFFYLVWDTLEILVQESDRYTHALRTAGRSRQLPPQRASYRRRFRRGNLGGRTYFAKNIRAGRAMTATFTGCYLIILIVVLSGHIRGAVPVSVLDSFYIASLFLYRFMQRIWPEIWYVRA